MLFRADLIDNFFFVIKLVNLTAQYWYQFQYFMHNLINTKRSKLFNPIISNTHLLPIFQSNSIPILSKMAILSQYIEKPIAIETNMQVPGKS